MSVGKITRVPLREVWAHEALDFTTWLEQNVDVLNEVLDFNLVSAEREKAAGDFSVDLVGEDEDGNTVVVENQLEKSDHDHLGKVLTYLAAMDAKSAVWIVARPRAEHVKAVTWLNEATSTPFYLVQVEAIRIGDSPAAPLFTRIVGPSVEARAAGEKKKELAGRDLVRREFWEQLLEHASGRTTLHAHISPKTYHWLGTTAGLSGLGFNYVVKKAGTRVELYIDVGDAERNARILDRLLAHRGAVEEAFGGDLNWRRIEGKQACSITCELDLGGWGDRSVWPRVIEATVDAMVRFEGALRGPVDEVKREFGR